MGTVKLFLNTLAGRLGSRKVVDLLVGGIALVALKLGLNIPDSVLYTLGGLLGTLIFGTAYEDAAINKAPETRVSITDITPSKN